MKSIFQIIFLGIFSAALLSACNKESTGSCDSDITCYTAAPDSLWIKLDLDNDDYNNPIHVKFYIGNMDDGELYDEFQTTNEEEFYLVPVNERYTGTAKYVENNDTTLVIDSDKLKRSSCEDNDTKCYDYEYTVTLDLKLD